MTCKEFIALLDAEGAVVTVDAAAHTRSCAACGWALERWQRAQQELRAMASDQPPAFLAERVMSHVREQRQSIRRHRFLIPVWRPVWLVPALAAVFVVALGGYGLWRQTRPGLLPAPEALADKAAPSERDEATSRLGAAQPTSEVGAAAPSLAPAPKVAPQAPVPAKERDRSQDMEVRQAKRDGGARALAASGREPARATPRPLQEEPLIYAPEPPSPMTTTGEVRPSAAVELANRGKPRPAAQPRSAAGAAEEHGALNKVENVSYEQRPNAIATVLAAVDGSHSYTIHLVPEAAPPEGVRWLVAVAANGDVALLDEARRAISEEHSAAVAALGAARLQPGEYWLARQ